MLPLLRQFVCTLGAAAATCAVAALTLASAISVSCLATALMLPKALVEASSMDFMVAAKTSPPTGAEAVAFSYLKLNRQCVVYCEDKNAQERVAKLISLFGLSVGVLNSNTKSKVGTDIINTFDNIRLYYLIHFRITHFMLVIAMFAR